VTEQDQGKILKTLQRATLFLTDLAGRGCGAATPDDVKKLKNIQEALRYWKLKRLSTVLGGLRTALLAGENDDVDGQGGREVSEAMTEALFTCKAVKTYFLGRLDDTRIYESLAGHRWNEESLEEVRDLTLVKVSDERRTGDDGTAVLRECYLCPSSGTLYRTDTVVDPLVAPVKQRTDPNAAHVKVVTRALAVPDFPPQRLILRDVFTEPLTFEMTSKLADHAPDSFGSLVTRYKAFRSNVFAPTDFYTLVRFKSAYSTVRDLYLVDGDNAMLRVDMSFTDGAQARFRHHLVYGRFEMIFGRLTVRGPDPLFVPLSIFHRDDRPPFIFLGRDLAP